MGVSGQEEIGKILSTSIPRELMLNFERLYPSALERALQIGRTSDPGHRASVAGHNRHFALNEALMHAFDECGVERNKLRGNAILIGKVGISAIARVHMNQGKWDNSRRSKAKVNLCRPNRAVASLMQVDWLTPKDQSVDAITAFLVTQGDGTDESPAEAFIVVPDESMDLRNPIFVESLNVFLQRYQIVEEVEDSAQPKLKAGVKRQPDANES